MIDLNASEADSSQFKESPVISSYLNLEELEAEGISSSSTFLGLSNNPELNGILAQRASELFRPDLIAILSQSPLDSGTDLSVIAPNIQIAFAPQIDLELWNQYLNQDQAQVIEIVLRSQTYTAQQTELQMLIGSGEFLPLLIERDQNLRIMLAKEVWQPSDRIVGLLHKSASSDAIVSLLQPVTPVMS